MIERALAGCQLLMRGNHRWNTRWSVCLPSPELGESSSAEGVIAEGAIVAGALHRRVAGGCEDNEELRYRGEQ